MERTAVESSNIQSWAYDEDSMVLEVEFKGGRVYHYRDVPPDVWASSDAYPSIGKFVAHVIKPTYEFGHGEFTPPEPEPDTTDTEDDEPLMERCPKCEVLIPADALPDHLPTCGGGGYDLPDEPEDA